MSSTDIPTPHWQFLATALEDATQGNQFLYERFFPYWFRIHGTPYFFLFNKSLSVTNIQHSELFALVRQHIRLRSTSARVPNVAFHTNATFQSTIEDIVRPVVERTNFTSTDLRELAQLYWPLICNSLVFDSFYTSCAVFLPPHLDIDLLQICAESGYINSCGYSLFIRRSTKATKLHFFQAIDHHFLKFPEYEGKLQFIPYSAEDFGDDKDVAYIKESLQDGLDGVKIRVEKEHMSTLSLVEIFRDMQSHFQGRLVFRPAGPYKQAHPATSDSTLWLIADQSLNRGNPRIAGADKYHICYHQLYFNDDPFHLFDENKPAWVAHNTIPHSLLGAMINVTKPWPDGRAITIGDPFAGTGTTWLEALKQRNTTCLASDLNTIFPTLVADNTTFFSLDTRALDSSIHDLSALARALSNQAAVNSEQLLLPELGDATYKNAYSQAISLLEKSIPAGRAPLLSYVFAGEIVATLESWSFFERLVFYIALRAKLRFQTAYIRGTKAPTDAFAESARYLVDEMRLLFSWRSRAEAAEEKAGTSVFAVFPGHYSNACGIRTSYLSSATIALKSSGKLTVCDARAIQPISCDVIVTDPPYGFNTEEDLFALAKLYADVFPALVAAVRSSGHLVVCLPSESMSGRPLPVCTRRQVVIGQILQAAERLGREAYQVARSDAPMSTPPYYWTSRALHRLIIHFRIRDI